jgi:2,3-dihydroxyethylbenzene 1,2-dioxygenase
MGTQVTELGYMVLGVKDLGAWKNYASQVLGLEVMDGETASRAYLRMDYWHHRFILEQDGTDDLSCLGFRVAGAEEFRMMHKQLADGGVKAEICSQGEARERHVLELMRLKDPSGNAIEIFHGPLILADRPFHPGRRMHGRFLTGTGGLGHLILQQTVGYPKTYDFYRLLGMRGGLEYMIPMPGGASMDLMFMHCNDRDHSVAFGMPSSKRINHVMLEVDNFDDVGLAYEIVKKGPFPVIIAPGKHANDHMYSFYFANPSGFMCEIGWGARPSTHQSEYYIRDTFGHEFLGAPG